MSQQITLPKEVYELCEAVLTWGGLKISRIFANRELFRARQQVRKEHSKEFEAIEEKLKNAKSIEEYKSALEELRALKEKLNNDERIKRALEKVRKLNEEIKNYEPHTVRKGKERLIDKGTLVLMAEQISNKSVNTKIVG